MFMQVTTFSQRPAKSAGSCADEENETESTVSEESCHPLMSMKSNAPVMSTQPTVVPQPESQAHAANVIAAGIDAGMAPASATPNVEGNTNREANTDGSGSPLPKDDTDTQVGGPSDATEYIPENGTVTHSCLLILLEVGFPLAHTFSVIKISAYFILLPFELQRCYHPFIKAARG
jgi:hypothetical protein